MRHILAFAALLSFGIAYASEDNERSLQVLRQALHAMKYGAGIKHGFLTEKKVAGRSTPFIEAAIAAPDEQIENVYAKVLAPHVSKTDAAFLLAFYTSPTGIQLVADQSIDPAEPSPPLHLTGAQLEEARTFSASVQLARFRRATDNPALQQEAGRQLRASLLK